MVNTVSSNALCSRNFLGQQMPSILVCTKEGMKDNAWFWNQFIKHGFQAENRPSNPVPEFWYGKFASGKWCMWLDFPSTFPRDHQTQKGVWNCRWCHYLNHYCNLQICEWMKNGSDLYFSIQSIVLILVHSLSQHILFMLFVDTLLCCSHPLETSK